MLVAGLLVMIHRNPGNCYACPKRPTNWSQFLLGSPAKRLSDTCGGCGAAISVVVFYE